MNKKALNEGRIVDDRMGAIQRLTMDNTDKKNAITREMYLAMACALNNAASDPQVRTIWLRGAGGVFSSGNDLADFTKPEIEEPAPIQFVRALVNFPKPIVAQVEGLAVGIGATMLLHCDLIYAAEDTRFRMPFVNLGVVPEAGSSYLLPRVMGSAKAAELILLGRTFSALEADTLGMVSRVLPPAEVASAAESAAIALSKQPLGAVMKSRALLRDVSGETLDARIEREFEIFYESLQGPEFAEAARAFAEKREPDYSKITL
ncbi:enoyl-CoA hydratase-related protein [Ruegeria sp. SCP11]|uniref:enoyl-CoA hydratase-related protein n=1 Tax=Ruegeria sp. SCP11 TaxID=3141378 RepID=UPI00333699FE